MKGVGRPPNYSDRAKVFLCTTGRSRLQVGGARRAIINALVESGGMMTLKGLDDKFGFIIRPKVFALMRAGWLRIEEPEGEPL